MSDLVSEATAPPSRLRSASAYLPTGRHTELLEIEDGWMELSAEVPSTTSSRRELRKRGRIACRQCRQAKLRCGLDQVPCSRCRRYGLDCTIDPTYRRSNKYEKFRELEEQVSHLQNQVNRQHEQHSGPSSTGRSPASALEAPSWGSSNIDDGIRGTDQALELVYRLNDSTGLTQPQVEELFSVYFSEYHYLLPMLEPDRLPQDYHGSSPLLFWSIIAVAARQYRKDVELLDRLSEPLNDLLWQKVAENPAALGNVQALILVSKWPYLNVRLRNDRSHVIINTAVTAAMQMGMHRPGREVDYLKEQVDLNITARTEWIRTWLSAAIMSQILSTDSGYPQNVSCFDWTVRSVCKGTINWDVPAELRHNLMIQECSHYATQSLSNNLDHPFGLLSETDFYPLMLRLEQRFDDLERTLEPHLSLVNRTRLYAARMYLESMYFLYDSPLDLRKEGVMKAFSTARKLISTTISDDNDILAHSSLVTVRMILTAATILFRVIHSSYRLGIDYETVRILFNAAAFSMRQLSVQQKEKNMPIMAAEIMRFMWNEVEDNPELLPLDKPPMLKLKSRMGASITFDNMRSFRRTCRDKKNREFSAQLRTESADKNAPIPSASLQNLPSTQGTGLPEEVFGYGLGSDLMDLSWVDDFEWFQ